MNTRAAPSLRVCLLRKEITGMAAKEQNTGVPLALTRLSASSWFSVGTGELVVHFDPGYIGADPVRGVPEAEFEKKADLVCISHFHSDHLRPEALRRIMKNETLVVSPPGFDNPYGLSHTALRPGGFLEHRGVAVKAVYACNTPQGHSTVKLHRRGENNGYLLLAGGRRVYFAGDTDCIPDMAGLGGVDIALLPIGGTYVMDAGEAAEAVSLIRPQIVVPMHQSSADMEGFKRAVEASSPARVMVLQVGEKVVF